MKNKSIESVQLHRENIEALDMTISTGNLAKQANGSVTIQMGETVVFVSVTADERMSMNQDFFPLSVEYREKFCAAGRFPGGYIKREGRPSEKEILTARLCDRPLRPLFPKGFQNAVQVVAMLLSADSQNESDVLVVNGASAALLCSDIPWDGPIGCVRIGQINGKFVVNPTNEILYDSTLDLLYVGNETKMMMIEGSADQIPEGQFLQAISFAHQQIQPILAAQRQLAEKVAKAKRNYAVQLPSKEIIDFLGKNFEDALNAALFIADKKERAAAIETLLRRIKENVMAANLPECPNEWQIFCAIEEWQERVYRHAMIHENRRSDGRTADELRPICSEVGFLPRVHGVSLFQRGETQALVTVTLGTNKDAQILDGLTGGANEKSFILHYNFPPFSVGETGKFGAVGRREVGHGALAERSLLPVIPNGEIFPFSIRIVSEILESNGSSSMATVCGGTLALMDAGVPILAPVAGISIGMVSECDKNGEIVRHVLLTDILGSEDHYGDMDFKIAGTAEGITGFQLDLKIKGLPFAIVKEAVRHNRESCAHILGLMEHTIKIPRKELRPHAPRMRSISIPPHKIGMLIGPSGKNIKRITEITDAQIDINEDNSGKIVIFASCESSLKDAIREIELLCGEIEVGKTYNGIVRAVKEFGIFVECLPGKEALVHISELSDSHIEDLNEVCKVGDEIVVKCVGVDERGRFRMSHRAVICESQGISYEKPVAPDSRRRHFRGHQRSLQ
ncbi:MAG: polyribonucleotide nucleotidyltransferase [Puniceicoccales bacterium]|nr:polyribonucleotide nucleotidyltransferase [Puniceicoccales bacterium]